VTASARLPSIAIIVPNRNDSRYLRRCLESVLSQDVPPDELIVVDDQSTDDSVEVIRTVIDDNPRARLIENPVNLGVYGAIHEGLKHSTSEFVLFLSANDFILPDLVGRAKACLARAPGAGLWSAMTWLVDEQDRLLRLQASPVVSMSDAFLPPEVCLRLARRFGNWFTGASLIFRREALDAVGGFDPAYRGLSDLIAALAVASNRGAAYSPEPLAATRVHAGSILSGTLANQENLDAILMRLAERGPGLSASLFTPEFTQRTVQRIRFASIRATGGAALADVAVRSAGWRGIGLALAGRLPGALRMPRVALAFLMLRPYDIVPTLWNRVLGSLWVRLKSRYRPPSGPGIERNR